MLSTSGNPLNTNNSTNTSNVNNSNSTGAQSTNKSNILSASSLINSEFMLPINNLTLNNNPMATTSSYLNDYNKLYRDVGIFQQQQSKQQQQQQQNNLIGNNNLNNLVVNSLTSSLNTLGNHHQATNNLLNNLPARHNLNGLPNHNLNNLQQQSINNQPTPSKQQLMNNSEFMMRLNRCNACLEANIFETALDEINHAINLVNNSALARFRKAQALLGLKRFFDCEKELWICINLEPNVIDYRKELLKVKQLAIMHFNPNLDQNTALIAAQKFDSIKDACESLMWTAPNGLIDFNSFQTGNNAGQVTSNLTTQSNVVNNQQQQQQQTNTGNNLNENTLLSGWNLNLNTADANNRMINFNALSNQLVNNSNMLFSNNGNNLITNNLLLSNSNMINRSNNGNNNLTTNTSTNTGLGGVNQQQQLKNQQTATSTNSTVTSNNQHSSPNQQAASNSPLTNNEATLTNGLSNLQNGNNRFNYLLRGLDQTTASHILSSNQQQQSTNGQANSNNNNQNLINNQQQLYNRIMPSFMDNQNDPTNKQQQQHNLTSSATSGGINNQAVLNCSRNLQSKLNLNENSLINGTNGLLIMNNNLNNSAPSPICAKLNSAPSNTSNPNNNNNNSNNSTNLTASNNLTNSCNYNIFNQMPEMKLIETIVPNLLNLGNASNLNSNSTGLPNHNSIDNQTDLTSDSRKLLASIAKEVNNNIGKEGNNLVTNLVDNFTNAVSSSIVNLQTQQSIKQLHQQQQQQQQQEDDCNKSANKKSAIDKLDLINDLNVDKSGVIDLKSSNNSVTKDDLFSNNGKELDNQNSPNNLSTNSGNLTSATAAVSSSQCTSYSDIVKRAKKISQTVSTSSNGSNGSTDLNNGTGSKPSNLNSTNKQDNEQNSDDSISSKRPTNLWAYNGLRVANVSLTASKQSLMNLFSKFGRIRLLERIINKTTTNNIWVYFDNPISPVDAVTKLQNVYIEGICVDSESPLRLFFAPTDDQRDLKFSRPKQPPDNKGECYYWRTTNCFSKDQCPLLHIQANKNIDAQVWMRLLNPENAENKDGEENNESTSSNNQTNENESANES